MQGNVKRRLKSETAFISDITAVLDFKGIIQKYHIEETGWVWESKWALVDFTNGFDEHL
jgi:hypothetical protein